MAMTQTAEKDVESVVLCTRPKADREERSVDSPFSCRPMTSFSARSSSNSSSAGDDNEQQLVSTSRQPGDRRAADDKDTEERADGNGNALAGRPSWTPEEGLQVVERRPTTNLESLPNELLLQILGFLDINDVQTVSRTNHHLRSIAVAPILHTLRLRRTGAVLAPLLTSPTRPSLADLIRRSIFLTRTTVISRRLGRSLLSIRLARRLAARPSVQVLVERCVFPPECAPGTGHVAPALVARTRAVERERAKDGLRRWIGAVWTREYRRKCEQSVSTSKVWGLRKFWERVARGEGKPVLL